MVWSGRHLDKPMVEGGKRLRRQRAERTQSMRTKTKKQQDEQEKLKPKKHINA